MSYWSERQKQLKKAAEKGDEQLRKRLLKYYETESKRLEKEIAAYYAAYGVDNVIQYRNLLQSLSDADKQLLIEQIDDFVAKYPQYADLVPVRESIYRLNRLEGLQMSIRLSEARIAGYTNEQMRPYLSDLAHKGANYAMETLGFGKNFYTINDAIVQTFVDRAWCNGENFSARIWNDTQKLAQLLNTQIAQGFARGDSYERLTRRLMDRFMHVNKRDAYRLIFTEGTYVMVESSMQQFEDLFTEYRIVTVGDDKVCQICRGMAGQTFRIDEREPGVNCPPFHPWCRCNFQIAVDEWDVWMDG